MTNKQYTQIKKDYRSVRLKYKLNCRLEWADPLSEEERKAYKEGNKKEFERICYELENKYNLTSLLNEKMELEKKLISAGGEFIKEKSPAMWGQVKHLFDKKIISLKLHNKFIDLLLSFDPSL